MTIRPLSLLTAGLFFLGGFLLVFPAKADSELDQRVRSETALTGFSSIESDLFLEGEDGILWLSPQGRTDPGATGAEEQADAAIPEDHPSRSGAPAQTQRSKLKDPGMLRGRVVWQKSRQPVSGVGLRLYVRIDGEESKTLESPQELDRADSAYLLIGEISCDGRGEFELESRASKGQICLVVSAGEDRVGVFSLSMAPKRGEIFDLGDLSLEETGKAVGRVLDGNGKPLKNAWVRVAATDTLLDYELDGLLLVREPEQRIVSVPEWVRAESQTAGAGRGRTDEEGFFQVDRVPAGPARISIQADQHLPHKAGIEVTAGQVSDLGDVSMNEGLALGGQLMDQRGMPVREAQVSVGSSGRRLVIPKLEAQVMSRPVFTDDAGRFRVSGLADGELYVAWRPSSEFDWQILGPFEANEDLRLRVETPFDHEGQGMEGGGLPATPEIGQRLTPLIAPGALIGGR